MSNHSILIVEDQENLLRTLEYNLLLEGYVVFTETDGEKGLATFRSEKPDIVLLDVMLPGLGGFDLCRIIRLESDVPIIMLTAKGEEVDRVLGLELGADDYVVKPFSIRELLARVRALQRRLRPVAWSKTDSSGHEQIVVDNLLIDISRHSVSINGRSIDMTPREFDLLVLLASNKGRAMTRDQILDKIWGHNYVGDSRTVDVHIRWLRKKIETSPRIPKRIVTVRGVGYRFE